MGKSDRVDAYLIAGGKYHDIDFARLEVLKLLAEQPRIKVQVGGDFSDIDAICECDFIVSYTCDVVPTEQQTQRLVDFVASGKKWFALHGTNSILRFLEPTEDGGLRVDCPEENVPFMEILGGQFMSHPPIQPYDVHVTEPDHPLVSGISQFTVNDEELYLCKMHGEYRTLMHCLWDDDVENFVRDDWKKDTAVQPVLFLHPYGGGEVLYFTLGHSRRKYDMQPLIEEYPTVEEGAWTTPEHYEVLRRGIAWAMEPVQA